MKSRTSCSSCKACCSFTDSKYCMRVAVPCFCQVVASVLVPGALDPVSMSASTGLEVDAS